MTTGPRAPTSSRPRSGWQARTWVLLGLAGVMVATAGGFALATSGGTSSASASVAVRPGPLFRLSAVAGSGPVVTLGGADGRPVLLSFFASWCDGCRTEMATMAQVSRLAGDVRVIGIDVNDGVGAARGLLRADHITYPVGADRNGAVAEAYRLGGLPTTVFLDARHRIVGEAVGPLAESSARRWVDKLVAP